MSKTNVSPTLVRTHITSETPQHDNPYIASSRRTYGYDTASLSQNISFSQMIFLAFRGELPSDKQVRVLDHLMVSLSNAGPRHGAVRAAMTAAISKSAPEHLLPIGLHVLGGERQGVAEVVSAAAWLSTQGSNFAALPDEPPGFGEFYGGRDVIIERYLQTSPLVNDASTYSHLALLHHQRMGAGGILDTGYCAALGLDLGFQPRECGALFQLSNSVGILAHAMEQTHYPISASTLLDDEHYDYQQK